MGKERKVEERKEDNHPKADASSAGVSTGRQNAYKTLWKKGGDPPKTGEQGRHLEEDEVVLHEGMRPAPGRDPHSLPDGACEGPAQK